MPVSHATKKFLSAVIRTKDKSGLLNVAESLFDKDDAAAFLKLRTYYTKYRKFPPISACERRFGFDYIRHRESVDETYDEVIDRSKYNRIRDAQKSLVEHLQEMEIEEAEKLVHNMSAELRLIGRPRDSGLYSLNDSLQEVADDYQANILNTGLRGIPSGWDFVDAQTGGFQNGDLISLVARPGMGKTYLSLYMAHAARNAGKRVLYVSPEVPKLQLARRLVGLETGIDPKLITRGRLSTSQHRVMIDRIENMKRGATFIIAAGNYKKSIPFIRYAIEEYEPDIVYVDASYLITPEKRRQGSGSRRETVSDTSEELKDVSASYNLPVIQTVQYNRQAAKIDRDTREQQNNAANNGPTAMRGNPLANLGLDKIGETDVIGQVSSIVFGVTFGLSPFNLVRRVMGFIKGREGEQGWWEINYRFRPVDLSMVTNATAEEEIDESDLDAYLDEA